MLIFLCLFIVAILLSSRPDFSRLVDLLASINNKWFEIGTALNVSHSTLQGFGQNNDNDTVKLTKVIHSWITTQSSVTWQKVIDAIDGNIVNNRAKANEICVHLGLPKLTEQFLL